VRNVVKKLRLIWPPQGKLDVLSVEARYSINQGLRLQEGLKQFEKQFVSENDSNNNFS